MVWRRQSTSEPFWHLIYAWSKSLDGKRDYWGFAFVGGIPCYRRMLRKDPLQQRRLFRFTSKDFPFFFSLKIRAVSWISSRRAAHRERWKTAKAKEVVDGEAFPHPAVHRSGLARQCEWNSSAFVFVPHTPAGESSQINQRFTIHCQRDHWTHCLHGKVSGLDSCFILSVNFSHRPFIFIVIL